MKKIFGALLLGVLALTGCVKSNNAYDDLKPVLPGLSIYQNSQVQTTLALQPANVAMRLALLLAEADKQAADGSVTPDFLQITVDGKNVKESLFGTGTQIVRDSQTGDYTVTFPSERLFGYFFSGSLTVNTGNLPIGQTSASTPWTVAMNDYAVRFDVSAGVSQKINFEEGVTTLYANGDGDGSYTVALSSMVMNIDGTQIFSDWSGSYRLRPEATSIAYSDCAGKDFSVEGSFSGPSIFSLTSSSQAKQPTRMSNRLSNGSYIFSGQIFTGTVVARLEGSGDYDATYYVNPEVKVIWTYDEEDNRLDQEIQYNGYTY